MDSNLASTENDLKHVLAKRYHLQQILGKGQGRRTFLALDQQTQTQVVVKCLTFGTGFNWQDLKLFEREAAILRELDHPAIPRYLDYFELDEPGIGKGFALVQTYISVPSLADHLEANRTFSEADVKTLAEALLEILIYLHEHRSVVIHRDIKPSNILLGDRSGNNLGQVYLIDFGSIQAPRESVTVTIVGTYGFMPPEQLVGRALPASDLYGLGMTLIYLLTGQNPADLPREGMQVQFQPLVKTQISPDFSHWLQQMVQPNPEQRFTSARAALQSLQNPQESPARPPQIRASYPANTRVKLFKTENTLTILTPQAYHYPSKRQAAIDNNIFSFAWFAILLGTVYVYAMMSYFKDILKNFSAINSGLDLLGFLMHFFVSLLPVLALYSLGFYLITDALFSRYRLYIDSEKLCVFYELFCFSRALKPAIKLSEVKHLRLDLHRKNLIISSEKANKNTHKTTIALTASDHNLNDNDLKWLADELSQWLSVPKV
jgi:serine/threonine protein kinase